MPLELGLSGYSQWQVDDDSGDDVIQVLEVKDEVHALGGQRGLTYVPWNAAFIFRYMKKYDAEARFDSGLSISRSGGIRYVKTSRLKMLVFTILTKNYNLCNLFHT